MTIFLAKWPLGILVAIVIAILVAELAGLLTEQWRFTLSEIAARRPDMAVWAALLVGILVGGVFGHIATVVRR